MKTKKWVIALAGVLMIGQSLAGCSSKPQDSLKVVSQKTYELGDPVSLDPADYLLEEDQNSDSENITVQSDLMTSGDYDYNAFTETVVTKGKEYLAAGTYTITLEADGQKYPVTITVKDTVMPEFISPAAVVTIPVGTQNFDFSKIYRTSDKDTVTLSVEGEYNTSIEGAYPVTLVAKDASGNTNSLEITINVVGKNQPIKAANQFDNEYVPSEEDSEQPDSSSQEPSEQPDQPDKQPDQIVDEQPDQPSDPTPPTACSISKAPPGTQVFYSFQDLYAAGTAWNQQNPNNYFFYLEGTDDCGNKVYFLTTGSSEDPLPQQESDSDSALSQTDPE